MTHIQHIKQNMLATQRRIIALLHISPDAYARYLYDAAIDWLLDHLHHDTLAVDEVMQTTVFWQWWHLHAYHRDCQWLQVQYPPHTEPNRLLNDWLYYHSADRLTNLQHKHAQILFDSYANINWKQNDTPHH